MAREATGSSMERFQTLSEAVHKQFGQSSNKVANRSDTQGQGEASTEWQQRKRTSSDIATFAGNMLIPAWESKTKLSRLASVLGVTLPNSCGE